MNLNIWLEQFKTKLLAQFGESIRFIGLQGSRARGEAAEDSDIDVVVIFDTLTLEQLQAYEMLTHTMPDRHLLCGFVSGMDELQAWDKADLFTFLYDTKAVYGSLEFLKPSIERVHIEKYIRAAAGNIYHMALHNYLHGKSSEMVPELFKNARFAIQGKVFLRENEFVSELALLVSHADAQDKALLQRWLEIKSGSSVQLTSDTDHLFNWAKETILALKQS